KMSTLEQLLLAIGKNVESLHKQLQEGSLMSSRHSKVSARPKNPIVSGANDVPMTDAPQTTRGALPSVMEGSPSQFNEAKRPRIEEVDDEGEPLQPRKQDPRPASRAAPAQATGGNGGFQPPPG